MVRKRPIHTTLSVESYRIIERFEHELGGKNEVLEKALDLLRNKSQLTAQRTPYTPTTYIPTKITGFDHLLGGGLNKKDIYSINGLPGTGKSTLALQYLLGDKNLRGIIFCEMHIDNIINHAHAIGKGEQLETAIDNGTIYIANRFNGNMNEVIKVIEDFGDYKPANRIVLDPVNIIHDFYDTEKNINSYAWQAFRKIIDGKQTATNTQNTTALIVNEITSDDKTNKLDFRCDGNTVLSKYYNPTTQKQEYIIEVTKSGNATPHYGDPRQIIYTPEQYSILTEPYIKSLDSTDI